jgi:hypothetical protein
MSGNQLIGHLTPILKPPKSNNPIYRFPLYNFSNGERLALPATFVETIRIAAEDRFIAVRFAPDLMAGFDLRWFERRPTESVKRHTTLRDLLAYGFADHYTLLCDCRHVHKLDQQTARTMLQLCSEQIPLICHESLRDRLEAYAHERNLSGLRLLSVRNRRTALRYFSVAAALLDDPFINPYFDKAAQKFRNFNSLDEREFAARFVQAHYDIETLAISSYYSDRSEMELEPIPDQEPRALADEFEDDSAEAYKEADFECDRDYEEDIYAVDAMASLQALRSVVGKHAVNSLLVEYAIQLGGGEMLLTPYHSHAIHTIEGKNQVVLGRPAVIAEKTATLLAPQICEFELLLRNRRVREAEIQKYLERSPALLEALGYRHVYPQVVLQRDDGTFLRPDFIVQPTSDEWCDIVDIKLPKMRTVVGIRDRKTLAAAVHELVAQLREYAAYFDNEKLSRRLEQLYGIKCYRPRLIGVIGTDPRLTDDRQMRRLMTAYSDVRILTFDQLLQHAKNRLLI